MENQAVNIESPKISYIPTVLRMDRRLCTGDVTCHFYDKFNEGLPCFTSIENCEYLIKAVKEPAEEKIEEFDSVIDSQNAEIEDLKYEIKELKTEKSALELECGKAQAEKNSGYDALKQRYNELLATTGIVSGKFPKEE